MSRRTYPSGYQKAGKGCNDEGGYSICSTITQFFARITPSTSNAAVRQADCDEDIDESDQSDYEPKVDLPKIAGPDDKFDESTTDLQTTMTVNNKRSDDIVIC